MSGRFQKGQSGNPSGRPKARRPHVSAFAIVFDKKLTVIQNGVERELTVDEALQLQTYQAALNGNKMAQREIVKMIEKREVALAKRSEPITARPVTWRWEEDPRNADDAMLLLGITERDQRWQEKCEYGVRMLMATWAAQAALSRPGRRPLTAKDVETINRSTIDSDKLKWPRGRGRE